MPPEEPMSRVRVAQPSPTLAQEGPLPSHSPDLPPWTPAAYRVVARASETPDTATVHLRPIRGGPPPSFAPGQFNMVYAPRVGEAAISICGDPDAPGTLVHTVRAVGAVTRALAGLKVGDVAGVRGPYGTGWPLSSADGQDVILVAGGLGLPPLRPVLYHLMAHRASYGRLEVVYGARTPKDLIYYEEIQRWRARGDLRFQVTVDAAGPEWYGDIGIVTQRVPDMRFEPTRAVAFLCGPEIMMKATARALVARGVAPGRIWVSMERNMKCGIGQCGHCQYGPHLLCRDGPVLAFSAVDHLWGVREV